MTTFGPDWRSNIPISERALSEPPFAATLVCIKTKAGDEMKEAAAGTRCNVLILHVGIINIYVNY